MFKETIARTMTEARLKALREKQGINGPNYCLGSSKFFIGKLIGLFDQTKNWNDFMNSPWAVKNRTRIDLAAAWGLFRGANDFNSKVLPAAIDDPTTNVNGKAGIPGFVVEFHHFQGNPQLADSLLRDRVPLVIGVDLPGGYARDHFISILRDRSSRIWVVDSWGASDDFATAELAPDFSFSNPTTADLNAADGLTTIPCPTPWIGYYRHSRTKRPFNITTAI